MKKKTQEITSLLKQNKLQENLTYYWLGFLISK